MSDRVYKKIELTGTSTTSLEEAIENAIARAAKTIRKMRWFEVVETRTCRRWKSGRMAGDAESRLRDGRLTPGDTLPLKCRCQLAGQADFHLQLAGCDEQNE